MVVVVWYGFRFWYCVSCAVLCAVLIVVCVVVVMFGVIYMWVCDCCGCGDVWLWRGVVLVAVWLCCGWWVWWSVFHIFCRVRVCVCVLLWPCKSGVIPKALYVFPPLLVLVIGFIHGPCVL